jgi:hypothetical protein
MRATAPLVRHVSALMHCALGTAAVTGPRSRLEQLDVMLPGVVPPWCVWPYRESLRSPRVAFAKTAYGSARN